MPQLIGRWTCFNEDTEPPPLTDTMMTASDEDTLVYRRYGNSPVQDIREAHHQAMSRLAERSRLASLLDSSGIGADSSQNIHLAINNYVANDSGNTNRFDTASTRSIARTPRAATTTTTTRTTITAAAAEAAETDSVVRPIARHIRSSTSLFTDYSARMFSPSDNDYSPLESNTSRSGTSGGDGLLPTAQHFSPSIEPVTSRLAAQSITESSHQHEERQTERRRLADMLQGRPGR